MLGGEEVVAGNWVGFGVLMVAVFGVIITLSRMELMFKRAEDPDADIWKLLTWATRPELGRWHRPHGPQLSRR